MTLERFDFDKGKSVKVKDLKNTPTIRQIVKQMRDDIIALDKAIGSLEDRMAELEQWVERVDDQLLK